MMLILRSMHNTQNIVIFTLCLVISEVTTRLMSTPYYRKVKKKCTTLRCSRILHVNNRSCGLKLKRLFPNDAKLLFIAYSVSRSEFQADRTSDAINRQLRPRNSHNAIPNTTDAAPKLLCSLRFLAVPEIKNCLSNNQRAYCFCSTHYRLANSVVPPYFGITFGSKTGPLRET